MLVRTIALALLLPILASLIVGCDGRRVPVTDFDQGFNTGVDLVRHVRKEQGIASELGLRGAADLGLIPADPMKSADWNAGFRQGVASELKR